MGKVQLPTHQSRHFSDSGIYSWMTVGELSEQFGVKEGEIFRLLRITPKTEDYKLTLLELNKKYNISRAEMTKGLQSIIDYSSQKGDQHE